MTPPIHAVAGSVSVEAPMSMIRYIPETGFWGRDSLEYEVYAPKINETKTAWVYINVADQPDNLYTDMCTSPPPTQLWGIDYTRTDEMTLTPYQIAVTGDIDGDGIVEIIVGMNPKDGNIDGVYRPCSQLAIYKGNDLSATPRVINLVKPFSWSLNTRYGIAKTRLSGIDSTLIVVAEADYYLRAYSYHGDLLWTSSDIYHATTYDYISPSFYDLNQDGIPEVIVGGKVFDSRDGKLLCATPVEVPVGRNTSAAIAADLYGTGEMNLIVGTYIYSVSPDLSTLTLVRKLVPELNPLDPDAPSGTVNLSDGGMVSVIDMDNDGKPELVIRITTSTGGTLLYIADPETGGIKASKYIPEASKCSYPFVGDIDGDGYPEIVFIKNDAGDVPNANSLIMAYKYEKGNPVLKEFWRLAHSDGSGATGITLFDFNQDGISELVYRDETHLRIINGSMKDHLTGAPVADVYDLATFLCSSGTGAEYPTIADVDGDGQAEIIIVGGKNRSTDPGYLGHLWIFKSEYPDESPWAPARKTWNQFAFNPVFINDDLTVPAYPLSPVTEFVTKTGKRHRPYNNFFQQATNLNDEGETLFLAPDIAFVFGYPANTVYLPVTGEVEVGIFIVNEGNAPSYSPLYVSVYALKSDDTYIRLHTEIMDVVLQSGEQRQIEFSFPYTPQTDYKGFEIRLNEKDGVFMFDECLTANNYAKGKMFSPDERIMCEGSTELIELFPKGVYKFGWYDPVTYDPLEENKWYPTTGGGFRIGENGGTLEITKNSEVVEKFYVFLFDLNGNPLSNDLDSVCVYLTPDSLIWTGAKSSDWHNYSNWLDPKEEDMYNPVNPSSKIPRKCTNVLIPDGLTVYPDLSETSTTYFYYPVSECGNITFEHGGEVIRTDSLDYDAAYIHQQLLSNRWYMLSSPLRDVYPGDYYVRHPNPHNDDVFIYAGFFGRTNPQNGNYVEGDWTGTFNTPGIRFTTGMGVAIWVDDKQPDASIHDPFDFYFPKYDPTYLIYTWDGNILHTHPASRGESHRFIYEEGSVWNRSTGDITLPISASGADTKVMVGNPFMSHWDFEAFRSQNPVKNYYQILDGNGQNFTTYFQYGSGGTNDPSITITTANPPLDRYIAPMQSILVESTAAFSSLSTHVTHMAGNAGTKLRSVASSALLPLYIDAEINGHTNRTVLILDEENALSDEGKNVPKVFLKENLTCRTDEKGEKITDYPYPVSVYTLAEDGTMLDMQVIGDERTHISVGLSTFHTGPVRLFFTGAENFSPLYDLYLVDTGKEYISESINLRTQSYYEFEKTEEEIFLNNRLYLYLVRTGTNIHDVLRQERDISLSYHGNILHVVSLKGEDIMEISVSDLQGRTLFDKKGITGQEIFLHSPLSTHGVYLVRCATKSKSRIFKIHY